MTLKEHVILLSCRLRVFAVRKTSFKKRAKTVGATHAHTHTHMLLQNSLKFHRRWDGGGVTHTLVHKHRNVFTDT